MKDRTTRRAVLLRALQLPLGGAVLFGLGGCSAGSDSSKSAGTACADPQALSTAEASMRKSLSYVDQSPNPQQACAGCAFFHAAAVPCGTCDMLNGGAVNAAGHCSSWSAQS